VSEVLALVYMRISRVSGLCHSLQLLGADVLPPAFALAVMNFRESHTGSVAGITRWSDHLDDMPALVSSIRAIAGRS
jgi:hypothetical protein